MERINFSAALDIEAAPEPGRPARAFILGYGGGEIRVGGFWSPLVVDLAGMILPPVLTLLDSHENSLRSVAGSGEPVIEGNKLLFRGTLSSNETGQTIKRLSIDDKVPLQASLGAEVIDRKFHREGESFHANGRTFTAGPDGLLHIKKSKLRELSILPLGADDTTAVSITAKGDHMSVQAIETDSGDAVRAERERVGAIHGAAAKYAGDLGQEGRARVEAIRDRAVGEGWDVQAARVAMLEEPRPQGGFVVHPRAACAPPESAIEASLLCRAGMEGLAIKSYGERAVEASRRMRLGSLVDVCEAALRLENRDTGGMSRPEMIRAALSTYSLPNMFSNVTGKVLVEAYREGVASWRGFAAVKSASDFKPRTGIRGSFVGAIEKLGKGGEVKHGTLDESTYPFQLEQYAKRFTIDRKDVINDDLGFVDTIPVMMGRAASSAVNDRLYTVLLANGGSFFGSGNANQITDVLGSAGLGAAIAKLRKQTADDGRTIDIMPRVLLVPPELEFTAKALVNSSEVGAAAGSPTGNPFMGSLEVAVDARLSNPNFTGYSATAWYLLSGPIDAPVIVAYLDGRQAPIIETFGFDSDPSVLALTFRVVHDFDAALGDYRAAVRSTGAGA